MSVTTEDFLHAFEAENIVQSLQKFSLRDVGTVKWLQQHEQMERLNFQAHKNLVDQNEEYISELFVTYQKLDCIIHDLFLINAWKKNIYPSLEKSLVKGNSLTAYFLLFHEATVLNLIQILFFHPHAVKSAGDGVLDLMNLISEKLAALVIWKHEKTDLQLKDMINKSDLDQFNSSIRDMEFEMSINCLGIFRTISDQIADFSITALKYINMACVLVHILQNSPWIRKSKFLERFENGTWKNIDEEDLTLISKAEGQIWLALMNLLLEPACRKNYPMHKRNKEVILHLKSFISDEVVDQLPPLVDLQRYLEELLILEVPDGAGSLPAIEPVSDIENNILSNIDMSEIIEHQSRNLLAMSAEQKSYVVSRMSKIYDLEKLDCLLDDSPICSNCGETAFQRCSLCKNEWYCGRKCQVEAWKKHKPVCELVSNK
ncbi:Zinc finger MYND domain-containing protein 10 [Boothiomyces sp. JEL0866]|nr:Zinc finger MYND domain-containing protein 10 [Boothiomyces sp. JEL0866]